MNRELKLEVMECLALAWTKASNHELPTFAETNRILAALGALEAETDDRLPEPVREKVRGPAPDAAPLNSEQRYILQHTAHRAAGGRYCGGSPDMDRLVELGYMEYLGTPGWCPDPFYGITRAGREVLRQQD